MASTAFAHPMWFQATAPRATGDMQTLPYTSIGGKDLLLDMYLPAATGKKHPVIIFVHGGGWFGGTRTAGPDFHRFFAQDGFAMVSIDYRLTPSITFPSNEEDVKTAIRWVRSNAAKYGLDPDRIGLWGVSAGGYLVSLAGLSPSGLFEGEDNLKVSSKVSCVLDAYGPVSFTQMDDQTEAEKATLQPVNPKLKTAPPPAGAAAGSGQAGAGPAGAPMGAPPVMLHSPAKSPESMLIGAPILTVPDKVKAASPLTYVKHGAPPFLIMHGMSDNSVPHAQSVMLYEALRDADCEVTLRLIDGLPHSFFNRTNLDDLGAPFRMDVRQHSIGKDEQTRVEQAAAFEVARQFFQKHLV